ncbi:hypothetical protein BVY01_04205 [bacterium I07]|nr:hypothetical protein BVY01_04205 [bacterium I07]
MNRRWTFIIVKMIIAFLMMIILIRNVHFTEIYQAFRHPKNPEFILLAFLMLLPNLYLQTIRWRFLLKSADYSAGWMEAFTSLLGGMVVGFITPGRIGEMGRSLFMRKGFRLQAVGLVFIDKLYAFVVIMLGGIIGMVIVLSTAVKQSAFIIWPLCSIGILASCIGILIVLHPQWIRTFLYNLSLLLPYRDKVKLLIGSIDRFSTRHARKFLWLTILHYSIYILQFCFLAYAFQTFFWGHALIITASTFFAKTLLPISIGDLGVREGAAIYFFTRYGIDKVIAFNSAILLFAINILIPTLFGLVFLPMLGRKNGSD